MEKMDDMEAAKLLKRFGIPVTRQLFARTEIEAVVCAKKIGYPLVLKVSSPGVVHKTDSGAIATKIGDVFQLRKAYASIIRNAKRHNPKVDIKGVIVQEMVAGPQLREVIMGGKMDPQFGPVVMFGLGGIFVEVMKDVSFGIAPIERKDARRMISGIKGYPVLKGVRGQKPVNMRALEDSLLKTSKLMHSIRKSKQPVQELDINPLFIDDKRAIAADVRIMV